MGVEPEAIANLQSAAPLESLEAGRVPPYAQRTQPQSTFWARGAAIAGLQRRTVAAKIQCLPRQAGTTTIDFILPCTHRLDENENRKGEQVWPNMIS
jgi:hypothetical protein